MSSGAILATFFLLRSSLRDERSKPYKTSSSMIDSSNNHRLGSLASLCQDSLRCGDTITVQAEQLVEVVFHGRLSRICGAYG